MMKKRLLLLSLVVLMLFAFATTALAADPTEASGTKMIECSDCGAVGVVLGDDGLAVPCETCGGTGAAPGTHADTCPRCGGTGQVRTTRRTPLGTVTMSDTCPECGGRGKKIASPCTSCGGSGVKRAKRTIKVKVPAGIDNGQTFAVRGEGHAGENGGPSGDLLVDVTVRPHPVFERDGTSVHIEMPVSFAQAALGAELEVPTIDGKVKYTMPEGTQTGSVYRLRGKGIPRVNSSIRGDEFVHIVVETPKNLTARQKDLLREFDGTLGDRQSEKRKRFFDKFKK